LVSLTDYFFKGCRRKNYSSKGVVEKAKGVVEKVKGVVGKIIFSKTCKKIF
jgi:hypothetical protein